MDLNKKIQEEIEILSMEITEAPLDYDLYLERAKLYYHIGRFNQSLNDFKRALQLEPDNQEAASYIEILREIFSYRYMDLYNP